MCNTYHHRNLYNIKRQKDKHINLKQEKFQATAGGEMEKDAENIKHHKHSIFFSLSYTIQSMCSLAIDRISYASTCLVVNLTSQP